MSDGRPHEPGAYPVVVVGSGPGAIQTSYFLSRWGVRHAVISSDSAPGGMFQRFPLFQRLITWTKPYARATKGTRQYEWYDWNSLLAREDENRGLIIPFMDGTSYFPSRDEMESGIAEFTSRTGVIIRYGCRWESTRKVEDGFVLGTSDGEYRCQVAVFAVGMTQPWKPAIPGIEDVPHYVETDEPKTYAGKRVFVVGKRNSGFEIADGLLPWASQIILGSPRPARISVLDRTTAAARARYLQPYEDAILGGGNVIIDAAIERIERNADGYRVFGTGTTHPAEFILDVDEVIAATGFATPLQDLKEMGVATFYQGGRLPAQTPYWESPSMPGIYFAGSVTQGAIGLKKYGLPSTSAAVHGFRYNARILAKHIARTHFDVTPPRKEMKPDEVVPFLLSEATSAPELWNQQAYIARILTVEADRSIFDDGIEPLAHFVDASGPDAIAITVETDATGDIHPAIYIRSGGKVTEHILSSHPLNDFETVEHEHHVTSLLEDLMT